MKLSQLEATLRELNPKGTPHSPISCCSTCGWAEISQVLPEQDLQPESLIAFYHQQDVEPGEYVYLTHNGDPETIVDFLRINGFTVENPEPGERICVQVTVTQDDADEAGNYEYDEDDEDGEW